MEGPASVIDIVEGNEGNEPAFEFGIRPGVPADLDFIADSWRRSYDDAPNTRCPGGLPEYISTQRQVIEQCLRTSSVLVAYPRAPEHEPNQILGWICFRQTRSLTVLHYVYVKPFWRNKREHVGTALLQAAMVMPFEGTIEGTVFYTHIPNIDKPVKALHDKAASMGLVLRYNPALIFAPEVKP